MKGFVKLILLCISTILVSCVNMTEEVDLGIYVPVESVSLSKTDVTMIEGQNLALTVTVSPSSASEKGVQWLSSNTGVATIDQTGHVTAVKTGTTTITVTTDGGGKTATCNVTVTSATATDLSAVGTANSYIVLASGTYKIKTVKGNSATSVGTVSSAVVLWESYGTSTAPSVGDLVKNVTYNNGYITFTASDKKGNAVIAAKDASGTILWSWHIWLTDKPADQVYNNNAGTMMDRNLGASSATPGDVGALGLLYQWGRKDPFLGSSSISSSTVAASTITWPSAENASAHLSDNNTLAYATESPTVFLKNNSSPYDWYCTSSSYKNDDLWSSTKTMYDPCPAGYKVPDGSDTRIWSMAFGTSDDWKTSSNWDSVNKGMDFGTTDKKLGSGTIWYPAAGFLNRSYGSLGNVGFYGSYWSCAPNGYDACSLNFNDLGYVYPSSSNDDRAFGRSVRCVKEGSYASNVPVTGVSLDKTSVSLAEGESYTLTATVTPSNATDKNVSWSSSDSNVATVSNGKVTAVKAGSANITVTTEDGAKTATCKVTVTSATATDLSAAGTANSYIVSSSGTYKIKTVKGNSSTSVGSVSSAEVLWESFGTDTAPSVGDIVSDASYADGYITFKASDKKGNAVIAAKNAYGTILWSWHIWLTDKPADQVYNNNAGTMMDRNLGATSATPGDVHALGLLYQWGRKDPFLGGNSISYLRNGNQAHAASTITWPSHESASAHLSDNNTLAYSISNPTIFLTNGSKPYDWFCTSLESQNNGLWSSTKSLYDPCPLGYMVPDGGDSGIWSKAFGANGLWTKSTNWDSISMGMNFGNTDLTLGFGTIWYPAAGYISGSIYIYINDVGSNGFYWTCMPINWLSHCLFFGLNGYTDGGYISPSSSGHRVEAYSVRCIKEE